MIVILGVICVCLFVFACLFVFGLFFLIEETKPRNLDYIKQLNIWLQ